MEGTREDAKANAPEDAIRCVHASVFVQPATRAWCGTGGLLRANAATATERLGECSLPVRGLRGPVNALDEGLGERTEGVLSGPFFSCDGSNVEAGRGGPAVEGSNARSRSAICRKALLHGKVGLGCI
jgi:hypothetical protein